MTDWSAVLTRPPGLGDDTFHTWFDRIAEVMLNQCRLIVGSAAHRLTEIEFYYHGPDHFDAFTHRNPLQKQCGRWYLHRHGGTLRNGSFKGLDLTFGDDNAHAGILIRGLEAPDGSLIDGPSLCVDHLFARTGIDSLGQLDRALAGRRAWHDGSPLLLRDLAEPETRTLYRSGRVGLSLRRYDDIVWSGRDAGSPVLDSPKPKRERQYQDKKIPRLRFGLSRNGLPTSRPPSDLPRDSCRPLRYLTEPRRSAKGRLHLVLALHAGGSSADDIRELTGCPRATLARYLADFESGRQDADFGPFFGAAGTPAELCRMHGAWYAIHGTCVELEHSGGTACLASS